MNKHPAKPVRVIIQHGGNGLDILFCDGFATDHYLRVFSREEADSTARELSANNGNCEIVDYTKPAAA